MVTQHKTRILIGVLLIVFGLWILYGTSLVTSSDAATAHGCNKPAYTAETGRLNAMCRDLGRRAIKTRPSKAWSTAWRSSCASETSSRSYCHWTVTHTLRRDGKFLAGDKCTGTAKVVGRQHFKVTYLSQVCVA